MTIFEIGIFKNQVLILYQSYYALKKVKESLSSEKRTQVINLIMQLSSLVLDRKMTMFSNDIYNVFFATMNENQSNQYKNEKLFIYAIGDLNSDGKIVGELLKELIDQFLLKFSNETSNSVQDVSIYKTFSDNINNVLKDERLTPIDRVKSFLFKGTQSKNK